MKSAIPRLPASLSIAGIIAAIALLGGPALSQQTKASGPVSLKVSVSPARSHPGETTGITVGATIAPGWHLYSLRQTPPPGPDATQITVSPDSRTISQIGQASESAVQSKFDPNFGKSVDFHSAAAKFTIPIRIAASAPLGEVHVSVSVRYETCSDQICLPPTVRTLRAAFVVAAGPVRSQYAAMPPASESSATATAPSHGEGGTNSSLLRFVLAAFAAGLLALLTPCVFPLIPVTFGFFTKQAGQDHRRLIGLAGAYAVGIVVSFTALGLIAAVCFGAAGANRVAANPWVNLFFGALFVVFAFAFFESFFLTLPHQLNRFIRPARASGGLTGVLFMGLAFVFAAFTCTAPFIGTVLVTAASATGAHWLRPVIGMIVFAVALALPFFLLALFPRLLTKMPKSGGWMTRFKAVLGFVELAYALTYFSKADLIWQARLLTAPVILSLWALAAFGAALYLLGLLRVSRVPEPLGRPSVWSVACAAAFCACGVYCLYANTGRPVNGLLLAYLPPAGYGQEGSQATGDPANQTWLSDYDQAMASAKSSGKPVFIDFTGYTCTNCRYVEQNIFPKPPVNSLLAGSVTRLRLYTDGGTDGPPNEARQQAMFQTVALPFYAIIDPDGRAVAQLSGSGHSVSEFADFITSGLRSAGPPQSEWQPYSDAAVVKAAQAGKPVIIDFTASWCTNCHALERSVFTAAPVRAKLHQFATYRADLTDFYGAKNAAIEKRYGILQLPAVLFLDAKGKEAPGTRVTGLIAAQDFANRMGRTLGLAEQAAAKG